MNRQVKIQDVGPRDGLQNEPVVLTPAQRARMAELLIDSGLKRIQVGSFVNPKLVPQMNHTDETLNLLKKYDDVRLSVLVLNERGLDEAIRSGAKHVEIFVSASQTHSKKNTGIYTDEALSVALSMIKRAHAAGLTVSAGVMCAFGCEFEGKIDPDAVLRIVDDFAELGVAEISLADTTGQGRPEHIESMIKKMVKIIPVSKISFHLHNTYGNAEDNLLAAVNEGVRLFDASIGGLGGCPFIPGASGNIATERVVNLLNDLFYHTGIDQIKLTQASLFVKNLLRTQRELDHI